MIDEEELIALIQNEQEIKEEIKKYKVTRAPFKKYSDKYSNKEEFKKLLQKYPWLNYPNTTNP